MPVLYCRDIHKRTGWWADVGAEAFTLGGSSVAAVPLPDRSLDAQEVIVRRQGDAYVLEDLSRAGRVRVNDQSLGHGADREIVLQDGDRIALGRVRLAFFLEAPVGGIDPGEPFLDEFPTEMDPARLRVGQGSTLLAAAVALGFCGGIVLGILRQALSD